MVLFPIVASVILARNIKDNRQVIPSASSQQGISPHSEEGPSVENLEKNVNDSPVKSNTSSSVAGGQASSAKKARKIISTSYLLMMLYFLLLNV